MPGGGGGGGGSSLLSSGLGGIPALPPRSLSMRLCPVTNPDDGDAIRKKDGLRDLYRPESLQ